LKSKPLYGPDPGSGDAALEEAFVGYSHDPAAILQKSFDEIEAKMR
jgi:hypothetical protein